MMEHGIHPDNQVPTGHSLLAAADDRQSKCIPQYGSGGTRVSSASRIESIGAVTLATHNMARAVEFYLALEFCIRYGGVSAAFTSFQAGSHSLNLIAVPKAKHWLWWGRVIFHVAEVDGLYEHVVAQGLKPQFPPRDAQWGERYFHITDPDGHELSFASILAK